MPTFPCPGLPASSLSCIEYGLTIEEVSCQINEMVIHLVQVPG